MTARRVAAYRLSFPRVEADFGRPDDDRRLHEDVAGGIDAPETMMTRYLRARTAFFDRVVTRSIERGIPQVVSVGAGYDGRSLRYGRPEVHWFELDHPDTQADKRARLDRLGIDGGGTTFAAADFDVDDVAAVLLGAGHDPACPTLYTCEGVAGYLTHDVLTALLRSLRSTAAPHSLLAITIGLDPVSTPGEQARAALDQAVGAVGEPLASSIPRADLDAWFDTTGWSVRRATDPAGVDIAESERNSAFVIADQA